MSLESRMAVITARWDRIGRKVDKILQENQKMSTEFLYGLGTARFDTLRALSQEMTAAERAGESHVRRHTREYATAEEVEAIEKDAAKMVYDGVREARRRGRAILDELRQDAKELERAHLRALGPKNDSEYASFSSIRAAVRERLASVPYTDWAQEFASIPSGDSCRLERHAFVVESQARLAADTDALEAGDIEAAFKLGAGTRAYQGMCSTHYHDVARISLANNAKIEEAEAKLEELRGQLDTERWAQEQSDQFGIDAKYYMPVEEEPEAHPEEQVGPSLFRESIVTGGE